MVIRQHNPDDICSICGEIANVRYLKLCSRHYKQYLRKMRKSQPRLPHNVEGSFAHKHPGIALEWHPTKNGDINPEQVLAGSDYYAWWLCPRDHEYEMQVGARANGRDCSYCAGPLLAQENTLSSCYPEIAKEWCNERMEIYGLIRSTE